VKRERQHAGACAQFSKLHIGRGTRATTL
jgi:hypothetical protein